MFLESPSLFAICQARGIDVSFSGRRNAVRCDICRDNGIRNETKNDFRFTFDWRPEFYKNLVINGALCRCLLLFPLRICLHPKISLLARSYTRPRRPNLINRRWIERNRSAELMTLSQRNDIDFTTVSFSEILYTHPWYRIW